MNNAQVATLAFFKMTLSFSLISQFYCPVNDLVTVYTVGPGVRVSEAQGPGEKRLINVSIQQPFVVWVGLCCVI